MKKIFIFLLFMCGVGISVFSQNYQAIYNNGNGDSLGGVLAFNSNVWRYDITTNVEFSIFVDDTDLWEPQGETLTGRSISSFNFRSIEDNHYLDEEYVLYSGKCVLTGYLQRPIWEIISDSIKTIENYQCLMAKGYVCGRDYTVWFSPDIPVSAGPWKLWGLPGLIMSAQSDDKEIKFHITSFKKIDNEPVKPMVKTTISPDEYKTLYNNAIKKMNREIRALSDDRGAQVSVTNITLNHPDKSLFE